MHDNFVRNLKSESGNFTNHFIQNTTQTRIVELLYYLSYSAAQFRNIPDFPDSSPYNTEITTAEAGRVKIVDRAAIESATLIDNSK